METEVYLLLQRIAALQSDGSSRIPAGIFSSVRSNTFLFLKREDDNVFFTALILFTLGSYTSVMNDEEKALYEQIRNKALQAFPLYTSMPDGIRLYNFWQKKKNAHFPGGNLLHRFKYFKLPDDIDDTALVWLAGGYTHEEIKLLQHKLSLHAAYSKRTPYHVPAAYKGLKLYSSWFGKNMPVEIDTCVLCNALYLVLQSGVKLNEWDHDNLTFLKRVIQSGDYFTQPFRLSANYAHAVIIHYHLTRIAVRFPDYFSEEIPLLKEHYERLNNIKQPPLFQTVLGSSAMRLGKTPTKTFLLEKEYTQAAWFRAGMMSTWENKLSHLLAPSPLFHMTFVCEAYAYTLNAEHFLLARIRSIR